MPARSTKKDADTFTVVMDRKKNTKRFVMFLVPEGTDEAVADNIYTRLSKTPADAKAIELTVRFIR
jgi:hypothetical protein